MTARMPAVKPAITERIEQALSDAGMYKRTVQALVGLSPWIWERKSRNGDWTTKDIAAIARITGTTFEYLIGDPDEDFGGAA